MSEPTASQCTDFLRDLFVLSPLPRQHEVSAVIRAAKAQGYSRRLVRLAKNQIKLVVVSRVENDKRVFYWRLP